MVRANFTDPFTVPFRDPPSQTPRHDEEKIPSIEQSRDPEKQPAPGYSSGKKTAMPWIVVAGVCIVAAVFLFLMLGSWSFGSPSAQEKSDGTEHSTASGIIPNQGIADAGDVTVAAEGDLSYYLGERIPFFGTNTATDTTYLFITGPGLPANGAQIENPENEISDGDVTTFATAKVTRDDTWSWSWNTGSAPLDAGTYTIYAASYPKDRDHLSGIRYGTVSIGIKRPFISATIEDSVLHPGEATEITGSALGNPPHVQIWTLGSEYGDMATVPVGSDGSFRYTISGDTTAEMKSGMYFIIVQHPMQNAHFDIVRGDNPRLAVNHLTGTSTDIFSPDGLTAAEELTRSINDPRVDDTYTKLQFLVE